MWREFGEGGMADYNGGEHFALIEHLLNLYEPVFAAIWKGNNECKKTCEATANGIFSKTPADKNYYDYEL